MEFPRKTKAASLRDASSTARSHRCILANFAPERRAQGVSPQGRPKGEHPSGKREGSSVTRPFHIVDVFAEKAYAGNPLAVVLEADDLLDTAMQAIAAETNYSETAFVASDPDPDGAFRVRLFTPAREIGFAGHPILGTGWVVREHVLSRDKEFVWLRFAIGDVSVTFETATAGGDVAWFRAPPMQLGMTVPGEMIAPALGLAPDDIAHGSPVQQVSAGTSALVVPIASRRALEQSRLDLQAFAPLAARGLPPLTYLWCREPRGANHLCARFFFEAHGVREDPATGNGAAFLGAYLLEHHVLPEPLDLRIEQGYEMGRPSLVRLKAGGGERAREVDVGGRVVPVVSGQLL
jgi:trans-2,3-dihydro-3-hydroxyanthranilate isomerase